MSLPPHVSGTAVTSFHTDSVVESLTSGQSVLLTGPAGIGKTHLLGQAETALRPLRPHCIRLTADPLGQGIPLGVFAGHLTPPMPPGSLTASTGPVAEILSRFATRRSSTVLLVDDVEHLDETSLFVIHQLITTTGVPTALTLRQVSSAPPTVQSLYDAGAVLPLQLTALSGAQARQALRAMSDLELTPRAEIRIIDRAGGNPLYLRELLVGSRRAGQLQLYGESADLPTDPTPTDRLVETIRARFAPFDEETMDTVATVALAGELPASLVPSARRDDLLREGIVDLTAEDQLRMHHPLHAECVMAMLSDGHRRSLMRRTAHLLLSQGADPDGDTTATSHRATTLLLRLGDPVPASSARAAARRALAAGQDDLAVAAAAAAVSEDPDDVASRCLLADAHTLRGDPEQAQPHLEAAANSAQGDADLLLVARSRARRAGLGDHDAAQACHALQEALTRVQDPDVHRSLQWELVRWGTAAGMSSAVRSADAAPQEPVDTTDMLLMAMSGVVTGPLTLTETLLPRLRRLQQASASSTPETQGLLELARVMACSYTGDVLATRSLVQQEISALRHRSPEALGALEYAGAVTELLSGDPVAARDQSGSAVRHLRWRDPVGLLPAALALQSAAALVTGDSLSAQESRERIPPPALRDPKVQLFLDWACAWQMACERRQEQAAGRLIDTAGRLLESRHTYLAGALAHCAVRAGHRIPEAREILRSCTELAGGGLLQLLNDHADAAHHGDAEALAQTAEDMAELGMLGSAADTFSALAERGGPGDVDELCRRRWSRRADLLRAHLPAGGACWSPPRPASPLLSGRELEVARLAAHRLSTREIADRLDVSPHTVTNQLNAAFRKLTVSSRAELRTLFKVPDPAESRSVRHH
ncbi:LuxR C-terminal-related transcriptional regulator [Nesterenkonia suensis]